MIYLIAAPELETYGGDGSISEADFQEARVKRLGFTPDKIFTSPKKAPRQISVILFGKEGVPIQEFDDLYYGKLEGHERNGRTDDMFRLDPLLMTQYDGEDPYEKGRICGKALDVLARPYRSRTVAVVTHKDVLEALYGTPFSGTVNAFDVLKWK